LLGQLSKSRCSIILFMNAIHCVTGFLFCEKDQGQWLSSHKHSIPTILSFVQNLVDIEGLENTTTSTINLFKFFYGMYLPWDNWDRVRGC
jgi:hypothetical protein